MLRFLVPSLLAAAGTALVEILRTWFTGDVVLGGPIQGIVLALCILGLLGLPLAVGGLAAHGLGLGITAGWRWGRGDIPPARPERRAAWVLYGALSLAVGVLAVQLSLVKFAATMRQPVYQGLAAGLVGAGALLGMAALGGPLVGLWARGLALLRRRLPTPLDPTSGLGAGLWLGALVLALALAAPLVLPELHSVDRRPAWLGLLYLALLGLGLRLGPTLVARAPRVTAVVTVVFLVLTIGGLVFAAGAAGGRQTRLLSLDRDTLLTAPTFRRLRTLADRDRDGAPSLFGGRDCDDRDPGVRPGIPDTPDDGKDQNCTGADLKLREDPLRAPGRPTPEAGVGPTPWNVVLLSVDAARDDYARRLMPALNALAAENVDYRFAYAQGAATYWSLPALLASTMPSRIEFGADQTPVEKELLLAEVLRDAGWYTALYANVTVFFIRGLKQGTDYQNYETSEFTRHGETPGAEHMTQQMLAFVDRWKAKPTKDRFFLWGHYYDPHDPYGEVPGFPAADDSDRAHYESNLQYTDHHMGVFLDGLKARGLWENTVVIVTADHGDEFLDHGHRFHGVTLYEEMVHVPLVFHVPGIPARSLDIPIAHLDVGPTLLDLLNVKIPPRWVGRSRAQEIRTGESPEAYPIYTEVFPDSNYGSHQVGMILGRVKIIDRLNEGYSELYRLDSDPQERVNLYDDDPDAPALAARLGIYTDHHLHFLGQGKTGASLPGVGRPAKPPRR